MNSCNFSAILQEEIKKGFKFIEFPGKIMPHRLRPRDSVYAPRCVTKSFLLNCVKISQKHEGVFFSDDFTF